MFKINVFNLSKKESTKTFSSAKDAHEEAIKLSNSNPNIKTEVVAVLIASGT